MDVEEQEVPADGTTPGRTLSPSPAAAATTATVSAAETSLNGAQTAGAATAASDDAIEEETYESLQSVGESEEMWDAVSSTAAQNIQTAAGASSLSNVIDALEPNVEAMEMLLVEREPVVNDAIAEAIDEDPLVGSDAEDDTEEEVAEREEDDEEDMQEFGGDVNVNNMLFNVFNRAVDEEAVEERNGREEFHSQVNALRAEAVGSRDRFHYPLRTQQLLQIRRALLSIGSSRHRRLSSQRANAVESAGDGENAPEEADESMGENGEGQPQADRADDAEPENAIRFDTNLPAEHSYLGDNMNRVSGVEYLDVGKEHRMMLFLHQHIVYPGEVLPFMISGSIIDAIIDSTNGLLFGVCFPFMRSKDNDNVIYGVTCQIYEKGADARGNTLIKSRALQRFATTSETQTEHLEYINDNPLLKYGHVRILPEIYLREPLQCIDMGSMNRFRGIPSMEREYKRYQAATTCWPAHIYNYYNISSIVEKARQSLAQHKIDTMPSDPIQLSFWLARNLHLSEEMMKRIFMNDTVNLRMKLISSTFKEESIFVCRICGNRIANCRELFAMSKHGVQTQYCNSSGYIHETNTVYQLLHDAIAYSGEPSSEFSWFPGYKWHIVVCKVCTRHIGWEFKAWESNLVPKSFFGISSSSVRISDSNRAPTNHREEIFRNFMRLARREVQ